MANKKITDLTELTVVASDDYLEIVDTSENTSKKISRENLTGIPLTSFTESDATVIGWSGTPTKQINYFVMGKLLLMSIFVTGTSNATTASVTIPSGLTSASQGVPQTMPVRVVDNGVVMQAPGMAILEDNGTVIQFYLDYSGSGFTASGTKEVTGNFAWIIA